MAFLDWFAHGWHQFLGAWLVVVLGILVGSGLRRAAPTRHVTALFGAVPVAVIAMLAVAGLKTGLDAAGSAGLLRGYATHALFALLGLVAGLLPPRRATQNRVSSACTLRLK